MKKVVLILGGLFILLMVAVISLPFLIDLNKYRPQIKAEIEKRINGKFEIESLGFKRLGVQIKNLSITSSGDFTEKSLLNVGEAQVSISLRSLLTFKPRATVILKKPQITIVKNRSEVFNVVALPAKKGEADVQPDEGAGETPKPEKSALGEKALPAFVLGAKLSFVAQQASLRYIDEEKNTKSEVEDLHISLRNISLNQPIDFSVSARLSSAAGKTPLFEGKFSLDGRAKVLVNRAQKISGLEFNSKLSLGELTAHLEGKISDLKTLQTDFNIQTPSLSLAKLKNTFGALKKYNVDGTLTLNGDIKGQLKHLEQCHVNAKIHLEMKSGGTDLDFKATLKDTLNQLKGEIILEAASLNLDELLPQNSAWHDPFLRAVYAAAEKKEDPFETLRNNEIFKGLRADGRVDIKEIIFRKSKIENLKGDFDLNHLKFSLSRFGFQAFGGKVSLKGDVDLSKPAGGYALTTVAQNLKMNPIMTMASPALKDTVFGTLNANMRLDGSGLSVDTIKQTMVGRGKVDIQEAELKGMNMAKTLQEEIKLISIFAGQKIFGENVQPKFEFIRSTLIVRNGKLYMPDAVARGDGYGATLKGFASFEKEIDYKGEILVAANKFDSRVLASLADERGMIAFPFALTGTLPKFKLSVNAAAVAQKAAGAALKKTIGEKVKEKIGIDLPVELPF